MVARREAGRWEEGGMLVRREGEKGEDVGTPREGVYRGDGGKLVREDLVDGCRALPVLEERLVDERLLRCIEGPGLPALCSWLSFLRHLARRFWNQTCNTRIQLYSI